jgi:hypothetical protein
MDQHDMLSMLGQEYRLRVERINHRHCLFLDLPHAFIPIRIRCEQ